MLANVLLETETERAREREIEIKINLFTKDILSIETKQMYHKNAESNKCLKLHLFMLRGK